MTIRPLAPGEAARTLAQRLSRTVDRVRQKNTDIGLRPRRVFLVWTHFTGEERGEGYEHMFAEHEVLPTPMVQDLSSISRRPYSIGVFKEGTTRVTEISVGAYTEDMLMGLVIPREGLRPGCGCQDCCRPVAPLPGEPVNPSGPAYLERIPGQTIDFWWEIREDDRSGTSATLRNRFRVLGQPYRDSDNFQWIIQLEAANDPRSREDQPQIGPDADTINQPPEVLDTSEVEDPWDEQ